MIRKTAALAALAVAILATNSSAITTVASATKSNAPAPVTAVADAVWSALPPVVTVAEARPASYVVVRGDTLSAIAARFCGRASAFPVLAARSGIANPDLIYPGQRVDISSCSGAAPIAGVAVAAAPAPASSAVDAVLNYARAQLGKPYRWGAAGPAAFDCSGLVMSAYSIVGVRLPHYTESMINYGTPVSRSNLRAGDVIWPQHGHVVLYLGNGQIIEAPHAGAVVRITNLYGFVAARRYV